MARHAGKPKLVAGNIATGANFFGREEQLQSFWDKVGAGVHLLFVSPRRVGKSSLMRMAAGEPRAGWTAVMVDLQSKTTAAGILAGILEAFDKDGLGKRILKGLGSVLDGATIGAGPVSVTLGKRAKEDWDGLAATLKKAILGAVSDKERLLLMLDEFPIALGEMLGKADQQESARQLLRLFREIRQEPGAEKRLVMVVGGSIGLMPMLRRYKITADANDLQTFHIGPWSEETARHFMDAIAETEKFDLPADMREYVLEQTGSNPIPFHLQKMLSGLKDLGKAADLITRQDVDDVRDATITTIDLDHYRDRIDTVVEPAEAVIARQMLDALTQKASQEREGFLKTFSSDGNDLHAKSAFRMLIEDGYLTEKKDKQGVRFVEFANPMLLRFWRNY